jgi:hypothetical protein
MKEKPLYREQILGLISELFLPLYGPFIKSQHLNNPTQKLVSKMHVTTQARITGSNHVLSVVLACGLKRVF